MKSRHRISAQIVSVQIITRILNIMLSYAVSILGERTDAPAPCYLMLASIPGKVQMDRQGKF